MFKYQFSSLGRKKKSYTKILNGNFPPVLEFPHLSFRTKCCQGQSGTGDGLCCMRLQQKDKRQVRQYFVLVSFRQSLQARPFISVQRSRLIHPQAQQKGPVSSKGSSVVPSGRKKQDSFSVGSCNFFSFDHLSSLRSYSWCNTSDGISLWGEVNNELPGPCSGMCPWSFFLAGAFACKN